jgi:lysophospholipase L1-like esterase
MTLFEHGTCLGDSLTVGARTRVGLAEILSDRLNGATHQRWLFRCAGVSGETVLHLLRRLDREPWLWRDVTFATLMIGTNDAKRSEDTPPAVFRMLWGQALDRLVVAKLMVFPALIPDVKLGASLASPYDASCAGRIHAFNAAIREECTSRGLADRIVDTTGLPPEAYVDGVHLSDTGIGLLADRFAEKITHR